MDENKRVEDLLLEHLVQKHTLIAFKKYEPYELCPCKSGVKFKFCCWLLRTESKTWKITHDIIKDHLTKQRIQGKIKMFENSGGR